LLTTDAVGQIPEKAHSIIDIAHKNSLRLALLVNDMHEIEKMVVDKIEFDIKPE
jgi:hypothetical protein